MQTPSGPLFSQVYDEMGDAGLKLLEQFGEDETVLHWLLKPWFKVSAFNSNLAASCVGSEAIHSMETYVPQVHLSKCCF